jgi:hypothetical protein
MRGLSEGDVFGVPPLPAGTLSLTRGKYTSSIGKAVKEKRESWRCLSLSVPGNLAQEAIYGWA